MTDVAKDGCAIWLPMTAAFANGETYPVQCFLSFGTHTLGDGTQIMVCRLPQEATIVETVQMLDQIAEDFDHDTDIPGGAAIEAASLRDAARMLVAISVDRDDLRQRITRAAELACGIEERLLEAGLIIDRKLEDGAGGGN